MWDILCEGLNHHTLNARLSFPMPSILFTICALLTLAMAAQSGAFKAALVGGWEVRGPMGGSFGGKRSENAGFRSSLGPPYEPTMFLIVFVSSLKGLKLGIDC